MPSIGSEFLPSACVRVSKTKLWGGSLTLIPAAFYGAHSVVQLEVKECSSRLWAAEAAVGAALDGGAQVWERLFQVLFSITVCSCLGSRCTLELGDKARPQTAEKRLTLKERFKKNKDEGGFFFFSPTEKVWNHPTFNIHEAFFQIGKSSSSSVRFIGCFSASHSDCLPHFPPLEKLLELIALAYLLCIMASMVPECVCGKVCVCVRGGEAVVLARTAVRGIQFPRYVLTHQVKVILM